MPGSRSSAVIDSKVLEQLALFCGIPILLCLLYLAYLRALPNPIPGIPYNNEAAKIILGDVSSMTKHFGESDQIWEWVKSNQAKLQSPIIQLFVRPFAKSWVVISDFREAQDILLRRNREFDRSPFIHEIFSGIAPEHHFPMPTNGTWKQDRRLIQDLMAPTFLYQVAAPSIYNGVLDLLRLWELKSKLSEGHPFRADEDVYRGALDVLWASMFGLDSSSGTIRAQIQACSTAKKLNLSNMDEEFKFPQAPNPPAIQAVLTLTHSILAYMKSPVPRLTHWMLRQTPSMRNAKTIKDNFIRDQMDKTIQRFKGATEKHREVRCAMDDILTREISLSEKEGKKPSFHSRAMYDEIFGFVVGAHHTTSTTVNWGLKFLSNPDVQEKLRNSIQSSLNEAVVGKRLPNIQEITKLSIPYFDAVIEEILRCGNTSTGTSRIALVDVEILGRKIPKGTEVMLMSNAPSVRSPAFQIDDSLRSASYRSAKDRFGTWNPEDVVEFKPERWIANEDGKEVFDPHAGPIFAFCLGPCGCYGRKLAYLQMKIIFLLIVWNFELRKCPEALSSYNAVDGVTHRPKQCYVRLARLE